MKVGGRSGQLDLGNRGRGTRSVIQTQLMAKTKRRDLQNAWFWAVCVGAGTSNTLAEPLRWVTLITHIPTAVIGGMLPLACVHWPWSRCPSPSDALQAHDLHGKAPASTGKGRESEP